MLNFTVGPVQAPDEICRIGAEQVPYFRTSEFSNVMFENERLVKKYAGAAETSRAVFITGSGTASMEAVVMNTLTPEDFVLIVNGGSFGERFVQLCELHEIPYTQIKLQTGCTLQEEQLMEYDRKGYTAFLVNIHETSAGVYYNPDMISEFCKRNEMFLIVDAISSFLADDFKMQQWGVDIMITGSQKALACPPGISIIVLSERAVQKVMKSQVKCMYLNLKDALINADRGQTPYTPAVGVLLQIHARLQAIENKGGVQSEIAKVTALATDFRERIKELPFEIASEEMSNAVTPLHPLTAKAYDIFIILKDEYHIWVCPNGGKLKDEIFRVGHIGALTLEDNTVLIDALKDMQRRKLI